MSRPFINRKICNPPKMSGFKPFGLPLCDIEVIKMQIDEYESINLVNYQNLPQEVAAEKMQISRPTFTRIYNNALRKIARAFVEGLAIAIEGGNVEFESEWYKCSKCFKLIEGLDKHIKCKDCVSFNNNELIRISK